MIIQPHVLRQEILDCLDMIDASIDEVKREARKRRILPSELRDTNGNWILVPLVVAKTQCLATLDHLDRRAQKAE